MFKLASGTVAFANPIYLCTAILRTVIYYIQNIILFPLVVSAIPEYQERTLLVLFLTHIYFQFM